MSALCFCVTPTHLIIKFHCSDLDVNLFTGSIATEFGKLTALFYLGLEGNRFTGTIPTQIGQLSLLVKLEIRNNSLTGTIPFEFGQLSMLTSFAISRNHLIGSAHVFRNPNQTFDYCELQTIGEPAMSLNCLDCSSKHVDCICLSTARDPSCPTIVPPKTSSSTRTTTSSTSTTSSTTSSTIVTSAISSTETSAISSVGLSMTAPSTDYALIGGVVGGIIGAIILILVIIAVVIASKKASRGDQIVVPGAPTNANVNDDYARLPVQVMNYDVGNLEMESARADTMHSAASAP